jgi:hypothetical protein
MQHADVRDLRLEIAPLIAFRDFHAMTHENPSLDGIVVRMPGCAKVNPYQYLPVLFLSNSDSVRDGHSLVRR